MMSENLFSIIIPMYNAELTIAKTIESVIRQTYNSWEIVVVDDCSSDKSIDICNLYIEKFQSCEISLVRLSNNSGNAKKPCDIGIQNAKGQFCIILGDDDILAEDYLEKMANYISSGADVVIPIMVMVDNNTGKILGKTPSIPFGYTMISGTEACRLTIPEWQIGCNGMAFNKSLYEYVLAENDYYYMNSDELSERIILYYADKVALSDAEYYYYQHPGSITHKPSTKLCEMLFVDNQIINFVRERYDADLLKQAKQKLLSRLIVLQKQYIKNRELFNDTEWSTISDTIRDNYYEADWKCANMSNAKAFLYSRNYHLFALICYCSSWIDNIKKKCSSR